MSRRSSLFFVGHISDKKWTPRTYVRMRRATYGDEAHLAGNPEYEALLWALLSKTAKFVT
jgi:hypothetical protein